MKLSSGVDLVEIGRLEEAINRHGERFLERIYTPLELEQCGKNMASLAARFAAKEAVAKALGTGIGQVGWREIEITRGTNREPVLRLYGEAERRARELGLQTWSISLSHTGNMAAATATAIGDQN